MAERRAEETSRTGNKNVHGKHDKETAAILEKNGAQHIECAVTKCVVDKTNKVVSTPAYMLAHSINEVATGIECLVKELLALLP